MQLYPQTVSKVISKRLKRVLKKQISGEQFGFLQGRQIHEAIRIAHEKIGLMEKIMLCSFTKKV